MSAQDGHYTQYMRRRYTHTKKHGLFNQAIIEDR